MGRSKKNWDHLVDFFGNYGIDIENGIYPGSPNAPGIKGNKGEEGLRGFKGDKGGKGNKGDKGFGPKGAKGVTGPDGEKGAKGEPAGLFTFMGTKPDMGSLPNDPENGDVWWISGDGNLVVWDEGESDWIVLEGTLSVKGDKGEEGDIGPKGEPGVDGFPGAGGAQGDKGEKGDNYDPLVLDDYYKSDQIDQMIEFFHEPEKAFDPHYYKDTTSLVQNETVSFLSNDQQDEIYNPGVVVLEATCTILESPIPASSQIVVNYITDNQGRARGLGYQMIQQVFSRTTNSLKSTSYWRVVRPAMSEFGEWQKANFNEENYYDKAEIDARVAKQGLVFKDAAADNTENLVLEDDNGVIDPTFVRFHTTGGITLTRNGNRLTFDGSPLAGQLLFLGLIGINEDASVSVPDAQPGNYFIFKENGTDINTGEEVAVGDWLIYGEDPEEWRHLPMGVSYGVAEVRIKGEKPYLTETGSIQFPELGFDTPEYERDFPGREGTIDVMNGSIFSLNDVQSDYHRNVMMLFDTKVDWNDTLEQGQYAINISNSQIRFAERNFHGGKTDDMLESVFMNPGWFLEVYSDNRPGNVTTNFIAGDVNAALDGWVVNVPNRSFLVYCATTTGALNFASCTDRTDIYDGNSLVWNHAAQKFIPGKAGEGAFVEKDGDTMKGDLNMDGNNLTGLPNPPPDDSSAASKEWVLSLLGGLVQPGMVVFWPTKSSTPSGWKKLDGGNYNVGNNPKMDAVLKGMEGYVSGKMPDWRGRFIYHTQSDSTADVNGGKPGHFAAQRTANSSGGVKTKAGDGQHRHKWVRKSGTGAGTTTGSNVIRDKTSGASNSRVTYYTDNDDTGTDGRHVHNIENWDAKTRPDAVAGYWIMKLD